MIKKTIGYLFLLVVVAGVSAGASYWVTRRTQEKPDAGTDVANAHKWLHEANLSSEQLEMLEPVETGLKRDLDSLQIVLAQERLALCALLKDSKPTPEMLQAKSARISQLETAQQDLVVKHLQMLSEILSPPQKEAFFTAMMHDICTGCRNDFCKPGTPCMCGHCDRGEKHEG